MPTSGPVNYYPLIFIVRMLDNNASFVNTQASFYGWQIQLKNTCLQALRVRLAPNGSPELIEQLQGHRKVAMLG